MQCFQRANHSYIPMVSFWFVAYLRFISFALAEVTTTWRVCRTWHLRFKKRRRPPLIWIALGGWHGCYTTSRSVRNHVGKVAVHAYFTYHKHSCICAYMLYNQCLHRTFVHALHLCSWCGQDLETLQWKYQHRRNDINNKLRFSLEIYALCMFGLQ